jgi:hypothetical protein
MRDEAFDAERRRIDADLIARDKTHVPQIRGKTDQKFRFPSPQQLELTSSRCLRTRASHDRHRPRVLPDSLACEHTSIGQTH